MRLIDSFRRTESRAAVQIAPTWERSEQVTFTQLTPYQVNSVVFAVVNARAKVFSEADVAFKRLRNKELWSNQSLELLQKPWPDGTLADLLWKMEQHGSLAGNAYVYRAEPDLLQVLDPTKVVIQHNGRRKTGYEYWPDGRETGRPVPLRLDEVAHWAPIPHPAKNWVGLSWVQVVLSELRTDIKLIGHQEKFLDNAATPNMVVSFKGEVPNLKDLREAIDRRYAGVDNAFKTMVLDMDPTIQTVGADFRQMDYVNQQKSTEARIASAGGVPPIIIGLKAGLDAATYSNYGLAMRAFADHTIRPLWHSAVSSLANLLEVPAGSQLWYDDRHVAALQQDKKDEADIQGLNSRTLRTYLDAGFTADSAILAATTGDLTNLEHSGLFSVQLQPPGVTSPAAQTDVDSEEPDE